MMFPNYTSRNPLYDEQEKKLKKEEEDNKNIIPAGKQQETGLTRFIKVSSDDPEVIKDAKLNNQDEEDNTANDAEKP